MLRYAEKKNVKLTNWRHLYFSHFCWMVWGAGKFVVKMARVYRVNYMLGNSTVILSFLMHCYKMHSSCGYNFNSNHVSKMRLNLLWFSTKIIMEVAHVI